MTSVTLARHAMATRFELVLHGENPVALRAAGEEALDEIQKLEAQLSLYRPGSEISALNATAARSPVRVEPQLFRLLQRAAELSTLTRGAFDITVAPLIRCWGFMGGHGNKPDLAQIEAARALVGMNQVLLDEDDFTVRFSQPGVMLDLGSIGKGYALDRAVEILRDAGITSALVHGGTSTVCAIGHPPESDAWVVAIEHPAQRLQRELGSSGTEVRREPLARVELRDESLSMSAVWGKAFSEGDLVFGHVLDPRCGHPTQAAVASAIVVPSAADSDALSTALLTDGPPSFELWHERWPTARALVVQRTGNARFGTWSHGLVVADAQARDPDSRSG